jgi:uncharacterized protein
MIVLGAAAVLLIAGRALAGVYADYLWYESLGATALWRVRITSVLTLRVGSAAVASLFAFANLYAVRQSVVSLVFPRRIANLEIGEEVPGRYLMGAAIGISILLGILLALPSDNWMSVALARSNKPFSEADPYFGNDLGFFVYWLPLENALWMWAFFTGIVVSIAVILLYALTPSLKWQRGGMYASAYVRRHVTVLVGVLLLLLAWSFRLDMYSMLIEGSGVDGAFSWADHKVGVPGDLLLALMTLGASLVVLWAGFAGQFRIAAISVLTSVALAVIIREIAPLVAQRLGDDARRTRREQPYLGIRATYTRHAFAVDAVPRVDSTFVFPSAAAAMPWIPLWDAAALERSAAANRAAGDRAPLVGWGAEPSGIVADVLDSPSEGSVVRAPWTTARIIASEADERGAPLRDTRGSDVGDDTPIDAPLVYPGASASTVVSDSLKFTTGTPLESFWARLAAAWSMQNFRLLSGDLPQPRPTLIAHRDIRDRIDAFVPFFAQGRRVDPIVLGDSLYWTVDLYSVSDTYPLSRHSLILGAERSYLHHSAVAVVQASTGEIVVVADSVLDPIAESWKTRLPSLFGTWTTLPAGIRTALAPPVDAIVVQAEAFGRYGSRTESEPPRTLPTHDGADPALVSDPLPFVSPGGKMALTVPLVDETDRLRGIVVGVGGVSRGIAWYPLPPNAPRWNAILDRLRSVDSAGSAAREGPLAHGRVRVIPVRGGLMFLQPAYRWRLPAAPSLSRVAVLANDTVRSLAPPFTFASAGNAGTAVHSPAPSGDFRGTVAGLYATMRDALRRGDLVAFGRAFEALGRALSQGKP